MISQLICNLVEINCFIRMLKKLFFLLAMIVGLGVFAQNDTVNQVDYRGWKQGLWQKEYPNGSLRYVGFFKDDYPVGEFTYYYTNGKTRTILMHTEKGKSAYAKVYYENGVSLKAEGMYYNKKKDSVWRYYTQDGTLLKQESYKQDKLHGSVKVFYPNGFVFEEINFVDGIKDGSWKQYYIDGNIKFESLYVKNLLQGAIKVYHPNGGLYKFGYYQNSLKDGRWVQYDEEGKKVLEETYIKGKIQLDKEEEERRYKELDSLFNVKLPETILNPDFDQSGEEDPEDYY